VAQSSWRPLGVGCGERKCFELSSKNAGFYAFLLRKLYLWPETGTIPGDVKRMAG